MLQLPSKLASRDGVDFNTNIILHANQGNIEFALPRNAGQQLSTALNALIANVAAGEELVFPVDTDGDTLALVVAYLLYHVDNAAATIFKPLCSNWKSQLSEWDQVFLKQLGSEQDPSNADTFSSDIALRVIQVTVVLGITSLRSLACAWIASIITTVTETPNAKNFECAEKLRTLLRVQRGYSDAEYQEALAINAWDE